jgi:hypothetical protein
MSIDLLCLVGHVSSVRSIDSTLVSRGVRSERPFSYMYWVIRVQSIL